MWLLSKPAMVWSSRIWWLIEAFSVSLQSRLENYRESSDKRPRCASVVSRWTRERSTPRRVTAYVHPATAKLLPLPLLSSRTLRSVSRRIHGRTGARFPWPLQVALLGVSLARTCEDARPPSSCARDPAMTRFTPVAAHPSRRQGTRDHPSTSGGASTSHHAFRRRAQDGNAYGNAMSRTQGGEGTLWSGESWK